MKIILAAVMALFISGPVAAQNLEYCAYNAQGTKMSCQSSKTQCERTARMHRGTCVPQTKQNTFTYNRNTFTSPSTGVKYCVYDNFGNKRGCYSKQMCIQQAKNTYGGQCMIVQ